MKKRLEADLISIAHRILQLKNKSDINLLYAETQKLYEKLAVLKFIEEQYGAVKPTISQAEIEKDIEAFYDKQETLPVETIIEMTEHVPTVAKEEVATVIEETVEIPLEESVTEATTNDELEIPTADENTELGDFEADIREESVEVIEEEHEEQVEQDQAEEEIATLLNDESSEEKNRSFKAAFEITEEEEVEIPKPAAVQISFEDLLGANYNEPQFVKVDDITPLPPETVFEPIPTTASIENKASVEIEKPITNTPPRIVSLNDKLSKGIDIDLNDRIAFVKHLFGNNDEDYNRVLNQLITFDNFYETKNFIDEMVKPDYNNWEGKDNYAERFMDIIEKKFL
tara:strand:+ start:1642 stop:2670 length:1029 start_codon:yes stop_codon:yes gene_type:complete